MIIMNDLNNEINDLENKEKERLEKEINQTNKDIINIIKGVIIGTLIMLFYGLYNYIMLMLN